MKHTGAQSCKQALASLNVPCTEEIKLLVSLFYIHEPRLQVGTSLSKHADYWGSGIIYFSWLPEVLLLLPLLNLGNNVQVQRLCFSVKANALCLSETVTEVLFPSVGPLFLLCSPHLCRAEHRPSQCGCYRSPFPSTGSGTPPSFCAILLVMLGALGNVLKWSSGLLS